MSREIMQQALDALNFKSYRYESIIKTIEAELAKPEQEPVAWMYVNIDGECEQIEYGACTYKDPSFTFLYTSPPRKEWVGLTEDEVVACWARPDLLAIAHAIEAKLKEKNT